MYGVWVWFYTFVSVKREREKSSFVQNFALLVGYPPFSESGDAPPLQAQILKGLYTFPDEFWAEISEPAKDLIRKMMCVDSAKRLTITGVLEHSWLADDEDNTNRVEKIMHPAPPLNRSSKRSASHEPTPIDDGAEPSAMDSSMSGRSKRVKHWWYRLWWKATCLLWWSVSLFSFLDWFCTVFAHCGFVNSDMMIVRWNRESNEMMIVLFEPFRSTLNEFIANLSVATLFVCSSFADQTVDYHHTHSHSQVRRRAVRCQTSE